MSCQEMLRLGHSDVSYLVFNRVAAFDASQRLGLCIKASTLHSCAFKVRGVATWEGRSRHLQSEAEIVDLIRLFLEPDLDQLLAGVFFKKKGRLQKIRGFICWFIYKTLSAFMQCSLGDEEGFNPNARPSVCYYPAILYHTGKKDKNLQKLLRMDEATTKRLYCGMAKKIWDMQLKPGPEGQPPRHFTFDSITKLVQLAQTRIPCTVLAVDESQDLTDCQIDWLYTQAKVHGIDVNFVGDPAQAIYSFSGAKVLSLLSLALSLSISLSPSTLSRRAYTRPLL